MAAPDLARPLFFLHEIRTGKSRNWSVLLDESNIHFPVRLEVKNLATIFQDSHFNRFF